MNIDIPQECNYSQIENIGDSAFRVYEAFYYCSRKQEF